ncbi:MAG: hypothetical protein K0R47_4741 [Brevibacillus sp.]|nr:hypothetical protein [Brevibacillus sp.]
MEKTIDSLLERLLEATQRLEQAVTLTDSDPDGWLTILDEREELIGRVRESAIDGTALTATQRQQLTQVYEINQRLLPLMDGRKQGVQKQLNNVQRSKMAMNTYHDMGPSGYGAFFDRKK